MKIKHFILILIIVFVMILIIAVEVLKRSNYEYEKGVEYYNSGNFYVAKNSLENVIKYAPKYHLAQELLKTIKIKEDSITDKKINDIEKKVKSIPSSNINKNLEAYKELAILDPTNKKYKNKIEFYEKKFEQKRINDLEKKVKGIPSSNITANLETYYELAKLDPKNERYKNKIEFYETKDRQQIREQIQERELKTPNFKMDLEIVKFSSSSSEFLASWTVHLRNNSKYITYKDINFKVSYYGESRTIIYESLMGHTEYIIIKPKTTRIIKFDDFMMPSQAKSASIYIDKADNN